MELWNTYNAHALVEAVELAAKDDKTWCERERRALKAIAEGIYSQNWNNAYMAGEETKNGKHWDGTVEDLLPIKAGMRIIPDCEDIRLWSYGFRQDKFFAHEALDGWNIRREMTELLSRLGKLTELHSYEGLGKQFRTVDCVTIELENNAFWKILCDIHVDESNYVVGKCRALDRKTGNLNSIDRDWTPLTERFLAEHRQKIISALDKLEEVVE